MQFINQAGIILRMKGDAINNYAGKKMPIEAVLGKAVHILTLLLGHACKELPAQCWEE